MSNSLGISLPELEIVLLEAFAPQGPRRPPRRPGEAPLTGRDRRTSGRWLVQPGAPVRGHSQVHSPANAPIMPSLGWTLMTSASRPHAASRLQVIDHDPEVSTRAYFATWASLRVCSTTPPTDGHYGGTAADLGWAVLS